MSTYSFLDVQAALTATDASINLGNGAAIAEEGISFKLVGEKNVRKMGADGNGMHSLKASQAYDVTIRLLKTSPTNALLSKLYNLQKSNSKKWGKNTITFNQTGSSDNGTFSKVAFKKAPDLTYAADADVIEWEFETIKGEVSLGSYDDE